MITRLSIIIFLTVISNATETTFEARNLRIKNEISNDEISIIRSSFNQMVPYYLPTEFLSNNISEECSKDVKKIQITFQNYLLLSQNPWALKLVDSWGKHEDGILVGNRKALGFFHECLNTNIKSRGIGVPAKYCLMPLSPTEDNSVITNSSKSLPLNDLQFMATYATCMPSSCTSDELEVSVNSAFAQGVFSKKVHPQCQSLAEEKQLDSSEIFGISFFSILFTCVLLATIVDYTIALTAKGYLRNGHLKYLLCFSLIENVSKIFHLQVKPHNEQNFTALHGIRVLSIFWVILGHDYSYSSNIASNQYSASTITHNFLMQIICNGDKSVDTFFTMSGLLVAYNFFKMMHNKPKFPILTFYFHRIIRLSPPIAIYVLFLACISSFFVVGPFALHYQTKLVGGCRKFWWIDWTFATNFIYKYSEELFPDLDVNLGCVSQCWYIAVDMQIYIIVPLILLPIIYFKNKIGLWWFGFVTLMSVLVPSVIIGVSGTYPTTLVRLDAGAETMRYVYLVYLMPWCRASPYFVGMWAGYLLWHTRNKNIRLSPYQVIGGWTIFSVLSLLVMFGMYPYNQLTLEKLKTPGLLVSTVYGGFHRAIWGCCISWLIIACHWGYGGFVNSFLSHPCFQPVSRLSFCIYLVSLPVQFMIYNSTIRLPYFSHLTKIEEVSGVIFFTTCGALILALISESPILRLEKIILSKRPSTVSPKEKNPEGDAHPVANT